MAYTSSAVRVRFWGSLFMNNNWEAWSSAFGEPDLALLLDSFFLLIDLKSFINSDKANLTQFLAHDGSTEAQDSA